MAAGEGTRLRPVTERWPKPILPIDGRPVIATLLRELAAAGVDRAVVVTGHLAEQVEELVGDEGAFGLEVAFVRQPEAVGSADAVRRALAGGAVPPFLVSAADTVYREGDIARFHAAAGPHAGALAVRRVPAPDPVHRQPVLIEDGLVRRVIDDDPENPLAAAPLWWFGRELVPYLEGVAGLADAAQAAIDAGLAIAGIEIGNTRDLTHSVDLVERNFPYLSR